MLMLEHCSAVILQDIREVRREAHSAAVSPHKPVIELAHRPTPHMRVAVFKGTLQVCGSRCFLSLLTRQPNSALPPQDFVDMHGPIFGMSDTVYVGFNTGLGR